MQHLLDQVNVDEKNVEYVYSGTCLRRGIDEFCSHSNVEPRRAWVIDQISTFLKSTNVPKSKEITELALDWLAVHASFEIKSKPMSIHKIVSLASDFGIEVAYLLSQIQGVPHPPFSDTLRRSCSSKLLNCLSDLMVPRLDPTDSTPLPRHQSYLSHVVKTIRSAQKDKKHFNPARPLDGRQLKIWSATLNTIENCEACHSSCNTGMTLVNFDHRLKMSLGCNFCLRGSRFCALWRDLQTTGRCCRFVDSLHAVYFVR